MEIKQGDLFWVDLGIPRNSEPIYRHPHVVIQNNLFNQSKINTVLVCALTSNLSKAKAPGNVLLLKGEGKLKRDTVANISQLVTVNKSDLVEKIGTLPLAKTRKIVEGVKFLVEPREA